ncbi:MAG: PQQ-binding-like beta-propeller repeat protein [Flavobacteriales bacterium]|nr:PQQ-binding-like beta-propeller repeat protein [Flavobacteriales bacterium]
MTLRERRPCEDTIRAPWGEVALKDYNSATDTIHPARQDYTADNAKTSKASVLWHIQDHSDIASGAIQNGKTVFFTNTVGELRAVSAVDGHALWTFSTGDKIFSEPTYSKGKVYISSADGSIYCIDSKKGSKIWQFKTDYPILSTPLVVNDVVYVGGGKGRFYALDAKKGSLIWAHSGIKGYMESRPVVTEGVVAIGSWASEFNAMDTKTGKNLWKHAPGLSRYFSPGACWTTGYKDRIYVHSSDKKLYCYNAHSGQIIWESKEPNGRESLGVEPDGSILYVKSTKDYVIAIDATSPEYKELWRANVGFGAEFGPTRITVNGKYAFVSTGNGKVYCLDKKTGSTMWMHRFSSSLITSAYPVGEKALIVTTMGGGVFYMQIPQ